MIDGLKLTMTGEEIRTALDGRIREHRAREERWQHEAGRPVERVDGPPIEFNAP